LKLDHFSVETLGFDLGFVRADCSGHLSKVTGAPSGKTTFVVVGENAGASKLNKIKEKDIPTLDEDGFLNLIRTSSGPVLDEKAIKAREKEEKKIAEQAREMEKKEREEESERRRKEKALKGTGIAAK
jgi:replication factor C subunit 1